MRAQFANFLFFKEKYNLLLLISFSKLWLEVFTITWHDMCRNYGFFTCDFAMRHVICNKIYIIQYFYCISSWIINDIILKHPEFYRSCMINLYNVNDSVGYQNINFWIYCCDTCIITFYTVVMTSCHILKCHMTHVTFSWYFH